MNFLTRLQLLGPLGLAALFSGGWILILVSLNTMHATDGSAQDGSLETKAVQFNHGSDMSIQAWLAVLGIGFGSVAYGLNEAYMHFFDSWCSHLARRECGLNYARYLNSQLRAPVLYGMRGFSAFITMRYLISFLNIAASIGYKFGIAKFESFQSRNYTLEKLIFRQHSLQPFSNGDVSPWLGDIPMNDHPRAFWYSNFETYDSDYNGVPRTPDIAMLGIADCPSSNSSGFPLFSGSQIQSWETVMAANYREDSGSFILADSHPGWARTQVSNSNWLDDENNTTLADAIVDYRIQQPDKIQIQWANTSNSSEIQVAAHRITYSVAYMLAKVTRTIKNESCFIAEVNMDQPRKIGSISGTKDFTTLLPQFHEWVTAIAANNGTSRADGITSIVRMVMTGWASASLNDMDSQQLGLVPEKDNPLKAEDASLSFPPLLMETEHTYLGCYVQAASLYMLVGCSALCIVLVRIVLGPPALTSWMGQHVYLALGGGITALKQRDEMLTGHVAAHDEFKRLRLPPDLLRPADWCPGTKKGEAISLSDVSMSPSVERPGAERLARPTISEEHFLQSSIAYSVNGDRDCQ
ncbi:hypothetical protein B0T10DRAFT_521214 [Thelonectria olida]|uniref:Uncharacterized protein n=1 Tax=Thelonectria olida TaxID=1576542 RepID=A0A9P8VSU1_9HYPO|nr:hypothetical protein B0T10DRAFT_521214 [Thelonectria olida]